MIDIEKSTVVQMIDYAKTELGIDIKKSTSRDEVIAILTENEPALVQGSKNIQEKPQVDRKGNPSAAVVQINPPTSLNDELAPDTHCIIGLNGRNYQIAYGEEVVVPYGVYDILNNAMQTRFYSEKDRDTGKSVTKSKAVKRYSFNLIRFID